MLSCSRLLTIVVLTAALLAAGLVGPAAGEPAPDLPETVAEELPGLPAARPGARVSKPVTTPMPFSLVGFEVPDGAELEFRTSADGETWDAWTEAHVNPDEGPDPESDEGRAANPAMSEPVWVGEAAHLQTRLSGGDATARPEGVRVHLIDSSGLGRSWGRRMLDRMKAAWRGSAPMADAAPRKPTIVTRAGWGANESWRRGAPSYASGIAAGFVHHTAGQTKYAADKSDDIVRAIYSYHVHSNGWSDIGYNFLVDRYGTIYEGRYGGITKAVIGAHAGGFNTATFGVSLMGTFSSSTPTARMRAALVRLLAWKYDVHNTPVTGKVSYTSYGSTRYASGQTVSIPRLSGHRHVSTTSCPGGVVFDDLSAIRTAVRDLQDAEGGVLLNPKASPSRVSIVNRKSVSGPVTFSLRLRPAAPWLLRVLDPAGNEILRRESTAPVTSVSQSWTPTGVDRGTYRYIFTSSGRRKARRTFALVEPPISVSVSPSSVMLRRNKSLSSAVTFSAGLYTGAKWNLNVADPGGRVVHNDGGTSSSMSSTWPGPGTVHGPHRWTLSADDVTPKTGAFTVYADRVGRRGTRRGAVAAAASISARTFRAGAARHAVLTRADLPAFALPAGPLAGTGGPVLLSKAGSVPAATVGELKRALGATATLYVMGGAGVISDAAVNTAVAQISAGRTVKVVRVRGRNAITVAARASNIVLRRTTRRNAILVGLDGNGRWRQGVAASAAGARLTRPVLLTRKSKLAVATRRALSRNKVAHVTVVSNASAVPRRVVAQRPAGIRASRIGGANATAIALGVSRRLFGRRTAAANQRFLFANISRRDGWARPLAAAPLAARATAPVIVTGRAGVPARTARYLDRLGYTATRMGRGFALGNRAHVTAATKDALSRHLQ